MLYYKSIYLSISMSVIVFCIYYLQYEVLICVVDRNDPAAMVANRLLEMYPLVDARLFLGI